MCLIYKGKLRTSPNDIKCIKIFWLKDSRLYNLFQENLITSKELIPNDSEESKIKQPWLDEQFEFLKSKNPDIHRTGAGWIHAMFKDNSNSHRSIAKSLEENRNQVVLQCIIPAGTPYVIDGQFCFDENGNFDQEKYDQLSENDTFVQVAAKKMIIVNSDIEMCLPCV
jgi:hypothetical protein